MDQESLRVRETCTEPNSRLPRLSLRQQEKARLVKRVIPASEPAFKPRKVKKAPESYRDRAEERRAGKEGDYAPVEAILEEFEKRNADNEDRAAVDEQRRYLGGDSDHSILVKGLDFALLEQNKARLASTSSKQDDEALEEVFAQTTSAPSVPSSQKRSRADIIKELKEKRANAGESEQSNRETERQHDPSKFRPIGFKPIGASTKDKAKKERSRDGDEPKKKKRKVKRSATDPKENGTSPPAPHNQITSTPGPRKSSPEPVAEGEDFDIFAEAGEYKGMDLESDDSNDEEPEKSRHKSLRQEPQAESAIMPPRRGWFDDAAEPKPEKLPSPGPAEQPPPRPVEAEAEEEEQGGRLAPLNSSAMPSIRDFLEMDEAEEKAEKRRVRKEKKKGKSKA
ncbi:RED-like protein N-terminal region-domain-containing protein [Lactarius psammicola]|nr:RED-like protein N-terminal region-domain-containing protein [Lactarius psammicola]